MQEAEIMGLGIKCSAYLFKEPHLEQTISLIQDADLGGLEAEALNLLQVMQQTTCCNIKHIRAAVTLLDVLKMLARETGQHKLPMNCTGR